MARLQSSLQNREDCNVGHLEEEGEQHQVGSPSSHHGMHGEHGQVPLLPGERGGHHWWLYCVIFVPYISAELCIMFN